MTADYFGENNNASNYGMVYSSKLISGLVGSGMGSVVVGAWDYHGAFVLAGCIGLASAVLALFLKAPGRPTPGASSPIRSRSARRWPDHDGRPHSDQQLVGRIRRREPSLP